MKAFFQCIAMVCAIAVLPARVCAEDRLTVFAAASLKDVLETAAQNWGGNVVFSFGGSGLIARQVAQGAPADIVILANVKWMEWLEQQTVPMGDRQNLISNRLVVVAPSGQPPLDPRDFLDRLGTGRLAVGQTRGVPAGIYARQWLESAGLWDALQPRLAETENVRAALALVSRGEAPFGIVYESDAIADPKVDIVLRVPGEMHAPIVYEMVALETQNHESAVDFMAYLVSDAGRAMFASFGFVPLRPAS